MTHEALIKEIEASLSVSRKLGRTAEDNTDIYLLERALAGLKAEPPSGQSVHDIEPIRPEYVMPHQWAEMLVGYHKVRYYAFGIEDKSQYANLNPKPEALKTIGSPTPSNTSMIDDEIARTK